MFFSEIRCGFTMSNTCCIVQMIIMQFVIVAVNGMYLWFVSLWRCNSLQCIHSNDVVSHFFVWKGALTCRLLLQRTTVYEYAFKTCNFSSCFLISSDGFMNSWQNSNVKLANGADQSDQKKTRFLQSETLSEIVLMYMYVVSCTRSMTAQQMYFIAVNVASALRVS